MSRRKRLDVSKDVLDSVVLHLEHGGTKKAACEMLGIAYNTKRLDNLIEEHIKGRQIDKEMRAKTRKTAVTDDEVAMWISSYLNGAGMEELSDRYYRSPTVIKHHLEKHGAMLRHSKADRLNPPPLPDKCVAEEFRIGEYVWSASYNCIAQVVGQLGEAYRIQVLSSGIQEYAYQPVWELGSLRHLEELGVDTSSFTDYLKGEEVKVAIYETMLKANKNARKHAKAD